ncbi:Zinc finger protein [Quillaja saponaria]|uniref:Zinc finger protein n=1 Tax=Quillaja saponaria TaxID=32244 RepID=A0AAD7L3U6_QUISA|nr:Zinc finger protein [Quillaja saponaria]
MALIVDQQSNFKHFCKICKKGFGCGRALGGHMRAHGIGDDNGHIDDEDQASDWEDKLTAPTNKRMYALRTNPNRFKSCRVCENCGKEFLSWKSFLEHGKCSSEDAESLVSSPGSDNDDGMGRRGCGGWSKRKRSFRAKVGNFNSINCPSSEEEDLANCLMMLSNATVDPMLAEAEESCASASKEEEYQRRNPMTHFIAQPISSYRVPINNKAKGVVSSRGLFECKACKKVFNSHQALGGHRASHKKVKGCFAARLNHLDDSLADEDVITHEEFFPTKSNSILQFDHVSNIASLASTSKRKSKLHECSICHRVFSSGQALGGHKRCHWITSNAPDPSTLARFHQLQDHVEHMNPIPKFDNSEPIDLKLDLNLPAPSDLQELARRGVSTEIYLQHQHQQRCHEIDNDNNDIDKINVNNNISEASMQNVDDEADSKVKLAKLSELKVNIGESSSPWLQVGIGSTTDLGADP